MLRPVQTSDVGVGHDAKQPRPKISSLGEGVEVGVGPEHRFLQEIFCIHGIGRHSARTGMESIQIRERVVDEPHGQLQIA
jgi:hypothetical protein